MELVDALQAHLAEVAEHRGQNPGGGSREAAQGSGAALQAVVVPGHGRAQKKENTVYIQETAAALFEQKRSGAHRTTRSG